MRLESKNFLEIKFPKQKKYYMKLPNMVLDFRYESLDYEGVLQLLDDNRIISEIFIDKDFSKGFIIYNERQINVYVNQ